MSLIALVSAKGSPGVTVATLALASIWPRRVLVAECDPAGGDLAARWGLPARPSLLTLAAAARRRLDPDEVWRHTQVMPGPEGTARSARGGLGAWDRDEPGRVSALLGPVEAEQAAVLGRLWTVLGPAFAALPGVDVLADCGRLAPGAPTAELLAQADMTLLVARPGPDGIAHARARLQALAADGVRAGLVLIGDKPHRPAEVREALESSGVRLAMLTVLADDPQAAAMLAGEPGSPRRLASSLLIRSARSLAGVLQNLPNRRPPAPAPAAEPPPLAVVPEPVAPEPPAWSPPPEPEPEPVYDPHAFERPYEPVADEPPAPHEEPARELEVRGRHELTSAHAAAELPPPERHGEGQSNGNGNGQHRDGYPDLPLSELPFTEVPR
jgi:hypothetical protein